MDRLSRPGWVRRFDEFLYKPAYFFLVALLTLYSNICKGELFTYTCFTLIVLYLCFFGRDLLPVLPLAICAYISPSHDNNPGLSDTSVFSLYEGGIYILALAGSMVIGVIYRLIRDRKLGRSTFWACKRKLLPGMLLLCGSYLLSGLGSNQFALVGKQNIVFALIQCAALFVPYFLITGMVDWKKAPAAYLSWTGMCVGYVLLAELAFIYVRYDIIQDGAIVRDNIFTGWGHNNNIGALLAMMIPLPFFLTGKGKHTSIFYISSLLFFVGVLFTCSRGSIIFAVPAYCVAYIISLLHSRHARANILIHILTILAGLVVYWFYADDLLNIFQGLLAFGLYPSGRIPIYEAGFTQFLAHPLFGGTFYPVDTLLPSWSTSESFVAFFPPRWHNTIIQILASCGTVGIVAYAIHRVQTFVLFLRRPSGKKMFAFVSMLTLLGCSLLDCHMFNVGPAMFYSMLLAFVEKKFDQ